MWLFVRQVPRYLQPCKKMMRLFFAMVLIRIPTDVQPMTGIEGMRLKFPLSISIVGLMWKIKYCW